jgi:hypothetical protein
MRNVSYLIRICCVGVQKEDRSSIGYADKGSVNRHNETQQDNTNGKLRDKNNEVLF